MFNAPACSCVESQYLLESGYVTYPGLGPRIIYYDGSAAYV